MHRLGVQLLTRDFSPYARQRRWRIVISGTRRDETMTEREEHHIGDITECPDCGSDRLSAVCDGHHTNFFCESCAACWLLTVGWITRVDPETCPGCVRQSECLAANRARLGRV